MVSISLNQWKLSQRTLVELETKVHEVFTTARSCKNLLEVEATHGKLTWVNAHLVYIVSKCLNRFLNVRALAGEVPSRGETSTSNFVKVHFQLYTLAESLEPKPQPTTRKRAPTNK